MPTMIAKLKAQSFSSFVAGYPARHIAAAIGCTLKSSLHLIKKAYLRGVERLRLNNGSME